jgi:propanol-preferring alcohol dehydrogenase
MAVAGAAGGVGHLVVQYAKHEGLQVIGIDRKAKEKFCTDLGVDKFVSFEDKGMVEEIIKISGGGVKSTVVVSGVTSAYT